MIPLFITESLKECHLPNFEVEAMEYTFVPNVDIKNDDFHYPKIKNIFDICIDNRIIILAHDCDEQGQLMASLIYHSFLKLGVSDDKLIRMPLTDKGIGYVGNFYSMEELTKLKNYYILERLYINKTKGVGFKKSMILKHLFKLSRKAPRTHLVQNKNKNGTNTVTYITKKLLGEQE